MNINVAVTELRAAKKQNSDSEPFRVAFRKNSNETALSQSQERIEAPDMYNLFIDFTICRRIGKQRKGGGEAEVRIQIQVQRIRRGPEF